MFVFVKMLLFFVVIGHAIVAINYTFGGPQSKNIKRSDFYNLYSYVRFPRTALGLGLCALTGVGSTIPTLKINLPFIILFCLVGLAYIVSAGLDVNRAREHYDCW